MTTKESLRLKVMQWARKQAEADLLFAGCKPIARLSEDEKRAMCQALLQFSETGAARAYDFLEKEKKNNMD